MKTAAILFAMTVAGAGSEAFAADPAVPLGRDPGGSAIALIGSGLDYTLPEIASALARDGEGEMIGWDFIDNDLRPYAQPMDASLAAMAKSLAATGSRLVAVRVDDRQPLMLAQAVAFVARTPARAAWLFAGPLKQSDWEAFRMAAQTFKDVKIQVPRCAGPQTAPAAPDADALIFPEHLGLPNVTALPCLSNP